MTLATLCYVTAVYLIKVVKPLNLLVTDLNNVRADARNLVFHAHLNIGCSCNANANANAIYYVSQLLCAVIGQFSGPYSALLYGSVSQGLGTTKFTNLIG